MKEKIEISTSITSATAALQGASEMGFTLSNALNTHECIGIHLRAESGPLSTLLDSKISFKINRIIILLHSFSHN